MYIDQQSDTGKKALYKLLGTVQDPGLKSTLKETTFDPHSLNGVDAKAYAMPGTRKFPVNTPENTLLSKVYYDAQKGSMSKADSSTIGSALDVHLKLHNIPEETFSYKVASTVESDAPQARYLLPEHKFCKVASGKDLVKAAKLFDTGYAKLQLADRVSFASNFVKAAEDFESTVPSDSILKYAGVLDYDLTHTQYALELRGGLAARKGKDGAGYAKLASALDDVTETPTGDELQKLACVIDEIDSRVGITEKDYGRHVESPHSAVFSKKANEASEVTEATEDSESVKGMSKADIVGRFGDDALDIIEDEDGTIDYGALADVAKLERGLSGGSSHGSR